MTKEKKPLILDNTLKQSFMSVCVGVAISLVMWELYFYLWAPVVGKLLSYFFGVSNICLFNCDLEKNANFVLPVLKLGLSTGLALITWAFYNWVRFGAKEKRKKIAEVSTAEIAKNFELDPSDLKIWQQASRLVVHFDDNAKIKKVTGLKFKKIEK